MANGSYAGEELSKAKEALRDAERLAASGGSDEGIVNRLYFAVFHAAQAVLYARGAEPSSHRAVRNLFGQELVLEGVVDREQGRLLTTLADLRQQADYGYEPLDVDIQSLREHADAFVSEMDELLTSSGDAESR